MDEHTLAALAALKEAKTRLIDIIIWFKLGILAARIVLPYVRPCRLSRGQTDRA
ncbi:MAG TPA: hypothetical protein P5159_20650 [Phycisphaerae bacterium]|nr:hypothetical protein [Phycisphaerae bacterium]